MTGYSSPPRWRRAHGRWTDPRPRHTRLWTQCTGTVHAGSVRRPMRPEDSGSWRPRTSCSDLTAPSVRSLPHERWMALRPWWTRTGRALITSPPGGAGSAMPVAMTSPREWKRVISLTPAGRDRWALGGTRGRVPSQTIVRAGNPCRSSGCRVLGDQRSRGSRNPSRQECRSGSRSAIPLKVSNLSLGSSTTPAMRPSKAHLPTSATRSGPAHKSGVRRQLSTGGPICWRAQRHRRWCSCRLAATVDLQGG